ncbi:MAG: DUF6261 family protein [Labilibaculum antarcticum]
MKNISYYLFSHKALFTFIGGIIDLVGKTNAEELGFKIFLEKTKTEFSLFESALKRDYIDPFTEKLVMADQKRDDRFLGFKGYTGVCKYRKAESWGLAAEELERLIARYGNELYRMAFAEESAALDNLIAELQTEPFKTAVVTIQANDWMDEMVEAEQEYKALNQERSETSDQNTNTIGSTRKSTTCAVRSLLSMISLQVQATANPVLVNLIDQLNNHISKSMSNARLSHSLNDKEETIKEIIP